MKQQFGCADKEMLIGYLYGECDADDRRAVEAHLASCQECADEVAAFGGVRQALAEWTPPNPVTGFRIVREEEEAPRGQVLRPPRWWQRSLPAAARVAAAVLLFFGGAALANLDIHYGADGLTVRTGWRHAAPAGAAGGVVAQSAPAPTPVSASAPSPDAAPWRTDLIALERQLRGDLAGQIESVRAASPQAGATSGMDDPRVLARVRALIDDSIARSEQRQQREFAYRVAQLQGEVGAQRRADLIKLQQGLGWVQGQTGAEVAQQRQLINYLLTVSQKK